MQVCMDEREGLPRTIGGKRGKIDWLLGRASINLQLIRIAGGYVWRLCAHWMISPQLTAASCSGFCLSVALAWTCLSWRLLHAAGHIQVKGVSGTCRSKVACMAASCGGTCPAGQNVWTRRPYSSSIFYLFCTLFVTLEDTYVWHILPFYRNNYGVFLMKYAELILAGVPTPWKSVFGQKDIKNIHKAIEFDIYTNGQLRNSR